MLECLRNKTTNEIALPALGLNMTFAPVIEDPSYGQFITDWPLNILNSGNFNKVPVLTGCNKDEGDITYMGTQDYYAVIDDNFFDVILPDLLYTLFQYDHNLINISYAVKAEYYDKIDVTNDSARIRTSIDMNTDSVFLAPNDLYVRKLAGHGLPVYTYLFAFPGAALHNFSGTPEISHAEELPYLFKMISSHFDENQTAVSDIMVDMWTNFATTFNPTPSGYPVQWAPTSASSVEYLYIYGPSHMEMIFNYRSEQMYFWNNIVADIILA